MFKRGLRNLELDHLLNNTAEHYYQIQVFVILKTCCTALNYFSLTSLAKALKLSSSERERGFLLMGSVQTSLSGFVSEREECL